MRAIPRSATAPVVIDADVVVCGAGSAGLGAALAAARSGVAKVALIERWPFFGGNATAASIGSICGLYVKGRPDGVRAPQRRHPARVGGGAVVVRLGARSDPVQADGGDAVRPVGVQARRRPARHRGGRDHAAAALVHLRCGACRVGAIEAVVIATKRGPLAVRGRVFVDATGDADVVFHAGGAWEMGEQGRLQYPSMQFLMQNVDLQEAMKAGLGSARGEDRGRRTATARTS